MPRCAISGVGRPAMGWPSKVTVPCEAAHRPMMVLSVVVLPAPLRPSSMVTWPVGTVKSTPCRMWYWPMWVCTPCSTRSLSVISAPSPFEGEGRVGGGRHDSRRACLGRQAEVSLLHHRRGDHLGRLAIGHQLPVVQHDDAVGELAHHVHLVFHEQDGRVVS